MAARSLTQRTDRAEAVAELRSLLNTMSEARADVDLEGRIEADLNFHRGLCRLSGNDTLLHTWESLEGSIRMSIMFAGRERAIRNMNVARHKVIVDAIASGDAEATTAAVHDHMGAAANNLTASAEPEAMGPDVPRLRSNRDDYVTKVRTRSPHCRPRRSRPTIAAAQIDHDRGGAGAGGWSPDLAILAHAGTAVHPSRSARRVLRDGPFRRD